MACFFVESSHPLHSHTLTHIHHLQNQHEHEPGLADLRSRIAVIPQEPTLFQGIYLYMHVCIYMCIDECIYNHIEYRQSVPSYVYYMYHTHRNTQPNPQILPHSTSLSPPHTPKRHHPQQPRPQRAALRRPTMGRAAARASGERHGRIGRLARAGGGGRGGELERGGAAAAVLCPGVVEGGGGGGDG